MAEATARKRKLGEVVAEAIVTDIRARGWPVGALIGTEAELMQRFGVSRATLLEAIRQVERHGVATMKRGGGGGLVVSNAASSSVVTVLSTYIELADISLTEQMEASRVLEAQAAAWAAERADEAAVAELRTLSLATSNAPNYLELSRMGLRVSHAVAEGSGNPALSLFIRAVLRARADHFQIENRRSRPIDRTMTDYAQSVSALVEAIAAGNASLAEHQLRAQRAWVDKLSEQRYARLAAKSSPLVTAAKLRPAGADTDKSAEVLAFVLRDEIVKMGWPEGARFGEEAELPGRFGVSRWVFRQAVRMLEPHAIVEMRRGQGGGLIIGRPDPAYTIEVAVRYLEYEQFSQAKAFEVLAAILEACAQYAAERASGEPAIFCAKPSRKNSAGAAVRAFYTQILNRSGNRILALFGRTLVDYLFVGGRMKAPASLAADGALIGAAISVGDEALARRRMRRHLDAYAV